jgi:N-dimethylarginine dimethylaminohydrolase
LRKKFTYQSEYDEIDSIILKRPKDAFVSKEVISAQWQDLAFVNPPDLDQAIHEYDQFEQLIIKKCSHVYHLPVAEEVTMDSIYCRDAALITDHGLILCNMGKAQRALEPQAIRSLCSTHDLPILGEIKSPGTVEGGDTAWITSNTMAVGHTYRTNDDGINQLRQLLMPLDIEVVVAEMPHYKGPGDVFHLMSVFSPVDRDLALVYSPLMPISFRNHLLDLHYHLIEVPAAEFESMGCNVLAIAPRHCIMVSGNPQTAAALRHAGCIVDEYPGSEISIKGGGGPTCLTRPLRRKTIDTGFWSMD